MMNNHFTLKKNVILFIVGFVGILTAMPIIPKLIALSGESVPIPLIVLQLISILQSAVFLLVAVCIGSWLAPKTKLATPVLDALLAGQSISSMQLGLGKKMANALLGGLVGGISIISCYALMSSALPKEFLANAAELDLPLMSRLLYGGITEELLIRWGLMNVFVWLLMALISRGDSEPKPIYYLVAIIISAVLFGLGHLPVAHLLAGSLTLPLVSYIIIANSLFGLIAGYLFWKHGLEAAIGAHMLAHVVMLFGENLL